MKAKTIELHIDELVLDGFAPDGRYAIQDAVVYGLTRLFAEGGLPPGLAEDRDVPHLDGGEFGVSRGGSAETIGLQIAQALHAGLKC